MNKSTKAPIILGVAGALLFVISAVLAYIFLIYVPSKPENVYKRGLESVGIGMRYLATEEFLENISTSEYSGNLVIGFSEGDAAEEIAVAYSGVSDDSDASVNVGVDVAGQELQEVFTGLDLDVRFFGARPSLAPKLYLRLNELDVQPDVEASIEEYLEDSTDVASFNDLLNTWFLIDFQELLDQDLLANEDLEDFNLELEDQLSQEDSRELVGILTDNLAEYIFTAETDQMVLQMEQALGEEDFDGTPTQKYSVSINATNLRAFLEALDADIVASAAWQKFYPDTDESLLDEGGLFEGGEIDELIEQLEADVEIEIWVDSQTRVLRNIRFTDSNPQGDDYGSYTDWGVVLADDKLSFSFGGSWYSRTSCEASESTLFSTEDASAPAAEACPYVFAELAESLTCGEEPSPLSLDFADSASYATALKEYKECSRPAIEALKADAVPSVSGYFKVDFNTEGAEASYEMRLEIPDFTLTWTLQTVERADATGLQEPERSRSIFEAFPDYAEDVTPLSL